MSIDVVAVDLGATSGRVIRAQVNSHSLHHEVVHRFVNGPVQHPDGMHWDVSRIFRETVKGLRMLDKRNVRPSSIGVDSWAVDYGLLSAGKLMWEPFHYRDARTERGVELIHAHLNHEGLYQRNGLQFLPFNTIYQLAAEEWEGAAGLADSLLLIPDLIAHWLGAAAVTEITNASATGLLDVRTQRFDDELVVLSGSPRGLFAPLVRPGEVIGNLQAKRLGVGYRSQIVAVGSHDTASAVVATPLEGPNSAYVSCGTWGLVGLELEKPILTDRARSQNFTNELGVDGRVRFLKNVMGLWLLNECVSFWQQVDEAVTLPQLIAQAKRYSGPLSPIDVNDPVFIPPGGMPERIERWCVEHDIEPPDSEVAMVASILQSLAQAFATAIRVASDLSGRDVNTINLTGGGAQNSLLCQRLADLSGVVVVAGPTEATALGNIVVQARAAGVLTGSLENARDLLRTQLTLRTYRPRA
jgi:rhamnulokinase